MAQHDYVIDNQSFPATRTDINNALLAISSTNSGTSAPSTTYANQLWYDTTNNKLYIRNEDNDAWIPLFLLDQSNDKAGTLATEIDIEDVSGTNTAGTALTIKGGAGTGSGAGGSIIFQTADGGSSGSSVNSHATAVTILDNGRVGIGDTSAESTLHVNSGASNTAVTLESTDASVWLVMKDDTASLFFGNTLGNFALYTNDAERLRVDTSGRLLIGHTTAKGYALDVDKANLGAAGFNRTGSDGEIVALAKDGTQVGSIISRSGVVSSFVFDPRSSGSGLSGGTNQIQPANNTGAVVDNTIDLGSSTTRFDDVFATNGTIQTSDQNEKQDIASLTSAEITAAKAISKLFKTFKWKSKVTSKGDNARTHTGVISQEVQSAMSDAGLDATKYAFWCSDTWWEKDVEVPAVEAVEAVTRKYTDTDGTEIEEVVTPAVEAKDAYTRTDTYETADTAPEGATERTRLGVRYPELLAFVGAATEQRLADIETRLTALEG